MQNHEIVREWTFLERLACARRWVERITNPQIPLAHRAVWIRFIRTHDARLYRLVQRLQICDETMLLLSNDCNSRN